MNDANKSVLCLQMGVMPTSGHKMSAVKKKGYYYKFKISKLSRFSSLLLHLNSLTPISDASSSSTFSGLIFSSSSGPRS